LLPMVTRAAHAAHFMNRDIDASPGSEPLFATAA